MEAGSGGSAGSSGGSAGSSGDLLAAASLLESDLAELAAADLLEGKDDDSDASTAPRDEYVPERACLSPPSFSPAIDADIKEAHKHRQVRALMPPFMAIVGVSFCSVLLSESNESEHVLSLRAVILAVHIVGLAIYGYVYTIADDARAHRVLVQSNETNTVLGAVSCFLYLRWHAANGTLSSVSISMWELEQTAGFFTLAAALTNLLVFPAASRVRMFAVVTTVLLLEPTFSPILQPLQGLFLVAAWGVGELVGRLCYRALLDVYIRQEAEMAGLREQVNLAMEHSYHVENERREQLIRVKSKAISPLTTRRKARGAHEGSRLDPIRD